MSLISTEIPLPLPAGLLGGLAADHQITLFLDYDGTISEITADLANAQPVAGATDLIARMAARPDRFRIIIISGRQTQTLARLLGISGDISLVGNHGLEMIEPGGNLTTVVDPALFMPDLDRVRTWMRHNVPPESGFEIEDKRFGLALHYRLADPDRALDLRLRLREFIGAQTPALAIGEGKMVIEARPRYANKGEAVRLLLGHGEPRLPVYFGDDSTDEDAFYELRNHGVTVKVCPVPCPSWAQYHVDSPRKVTAALAGMLAGAA